MEISYRIYQKELGYQDEGVLCNVDGEKLGFLIEVPDEELDSCLSQLERDQLIEQYVAADLCMNQVDFVWSEEEDWGNEYYEDEDYDDNPPEDCKKCCNKEKEEVKEDPFVSYETNTI